MQSTVEIGPVVLEKKMGKVQDNDHNDNDDEENSVKN